MIKYIVNYIVRIIKSYLYKAKLDRINREININRKEVENAIEKADNDYDDFTKLYNSYGGGEAKVRHGVKIVRKDGEKSEESDS